jgi:hypothetical protein
LNCYLAVCKDRPNDPNRFFYTIYFVNVSDSEIEELHYETGAFLSDDDSLFQTSRHRRNLGKVPANGYVEVETDDEGAFDYEIDFSFKIQYSSGKKEKKIFTIGKYFRNANALERLPVLNKAGYMIKES